MSPNADLVRHQFVANTARRSSDLCWYPACGRAYDDPIHVTQNADYEDTWKDAALALREAGAALFNEEDDADLLWASAVQVFERVFENDSSETS
jgi:hypothetical protein